MKTDFVDSAFIAVQPFKGGMPSRHSFFENRVAFSSAIFLVRCGYGDGSVRYGLIGPAPKIRAGCGRATAACFHAAIRAACSSMSAARPQDPCVCLPWAQRRADACICVCVLRLRGAMESHWIPWRPTPSRPCDAFWRVMIVRSAVRSDGLPLHCRAACAAAGRPSPRFTGAGQAASPPRPQELPHFQDKPGSTSLGPLSASSSVTGCCTGHWQVGSIWRMRLANCDSLRAPGYCVFVRSFQVVACCPIVPNCQRASCLPCPRLGRLIEAAAGRGFVRLRRRCRRLNSVLDHQVALLLPEHRSRPHDPPRPRAGGPPAGANHDRDLDSNKDRLQ